MTKKTQFDDADNPRGNTTPANDNEQLQELIRIKRQNDHAALPWVLLQLQSPSAEVRARAADALAEIGAATDLAVEQGLTSLLTDAEPAVRYSAIQALGALGCKSVVADLGKLLRHDADVMVQVAAAEALGYLEDAAALPALFAALGDSAVVVCRFAACSIGLLVTPMDAADLQAAVSCAERAEADLVVRMELLLASYRLGEPARLQRLRALLFDPPSVTADTITAVLNGLQFLVEYRPPPQLEQDSRFLAELVTELGRQFPATLHQTQNLIQLLARLSAPD